MRINYSDKAVIQLMSLDKSEQKRIARKMKFYALQDNPLRFAKYISYRESYRFRIGDYRIFFHIDNHVLMVRTIERRDKAYA